MLTYETHIGIELPWLLPLCLPALIKHKPEESFSYFSCLFSYLGNEYQSISVWRDQWEIHGLILVIGGLCFGLDDDTPSPM